MLWDPKNLHFAWWSSSWGELKDPDVFSKFRAVLNVPWSIPVNIPLHRSLYHIIYMYSYIYILDYYYIIIYIIYIIAINQVRKTLENWSFWLRLTNPGGFATSAVFYGGPTLWQPTWREKEGSCDAAEG